MIWVESLVSIINFQLLWDSVPFVLSGLPNTIGISISAFLLGNVLGLLLTLLRMIERPLLQWLIRFYISFMRGIPGLVLLFILYFGLPVKLTAVQAAILCFSLSSGAFLSEIYRGALLGVDQGQWDAAKALGLPYIRIVCRIILPQAFRIALPSVGNVAMDLVKATSLAAMITVPDVFQKAQIIGGREFDYMTVYILVALVYWLLCLAIGWLQKKMEQRFQRYEN